MAVAAFILSVLAILIAFASVWFTRQHAIASRRVADIEEERRRVERGAEHRATVAARTASVRVYRRSGADHRGFLVVHNAGQGTAERVSLEVVATVGNGSLPRIEPIAVARLHHEESAETAFTLAVGMAGEVQCRLAWTDGEGDHDERLNVRLADL